MPLNGLMAHQIKWHQIKFSFFTKKKKKNLFFKILICDKIKFIKNLFINVVQPF